MLDHGLIIKPLESINSFSDYSDAFKKGKIYDLQPLRDLSHKFDLVVVDITGFEHFPLIVNLLILYFTALALFKLFLFYFSERISLFIVSCFLFHPAIFFIFVEFTSRKHILSFLFFTLGALAFLNGYFDKTK